MIDERGGGRITPEINFLRFRAHQSLFRQVTGWIADQWDQTFVLDSPSGIEEVLGIAGLVTTGFICGIALGALLSTSPVFVGAAIGLILAV